MGNPEAGACLGLWCGAGLSPATATPCSVARPRVPGAALLGTPPKKRAPGAKLATGSGPAGWVTGADTTTSWRLLPCRVRPAGFSLGGGSKTQPWVLSRRCQNVRQKYCVCVCGGGGDRAHGCEVSPAHPTWWSDTCRAEAAWRPRERVAGVALALVVKCLALTGVCWCGRWAATPGLERGSVRVPQASLPLPSASPGTGG